jgi:hypothetical protein
VRGGVLPGFADVEEERRVLGGEEGFELVYGDFQVHRSRIQTAEVTGLQREVR